MGDAPGQKKASMRMRKKRVVVGIVCYGGWIVTDIKGECWPVKPDIFLSTYEPADSGAST
jgi:hypothetical protein